MGYLRLKLRPEKLSDYANPSFIGRRLQHFDFAARTALEFPPVSVNESAGLVVIQNAHYHFRFVETLNAAGERVVVAATDTGVDPVEGTLYAATEDRISVSREDARAGNVVVHFPRLGFEMRRVK